MTLGSAGRTVVADFSTQAASYAVTLTSGATTLSTTVPTGTPASFSSVRAGTWDVGVVALNSSAAVIGAGSLTGQVLPVGGSLNLTVPVSTSTSGTGSYSFSLTYSALIGIDFVSGSLFNAAGVSQATYTPALTTASGMVSATVSSGGLHSVRTFADTAFNSSNDSLSTLTVVDSNSLSLLGFSSAIPTYTVSTVAPTVTVTPTRSVDGQSIQFRQDAGGWTPLASGSSAVAAVGATATVLSFLVSANDRSTVQTYQVTVKRAYTVTYNANLGLGTPPSDSGSYVVGGAVTILGNTTGMTNAGYSFTGWNTNAAGTGTAYAPGAAIMPMGNLVLYAVWTAYTVSYGTTGSSSGTVPAAPTSYPANGTVTVLGNTGNLAGANLVFEGWNTASGGTGIFYQPGDTFPISGNVTLYPMWFTVSGTTITAIQGNPTAVVLPAGITDIGTAFANCSTLTSISMPGVTTLRTGAFSSCTSLISVSMPAVTSIGSSAFYFCTALPTLNFPATLLTVSNQAFGDCFHLTSISGGSATCPVVNGVLIGGSTLYLVPSSDGRPPGHSRRNQQHQQLRRSRLRFAHFPLGSQHPHHHQRLRLWTDVQSYPDHSAFHCRQHWKLFVHRFRDHQRCHPATVTSIAMDAFYACSQLTSVTMLGSTPPTLGTAVFDNDNASLLIHVPSVAAQTAYRAAPGWSAYSSQIVTP